MTTAIQTAPLAVDECEQCLMYGTGACVSMGNRGEDPCAAVDQEYVVLFRPGDKMCLSMRSQANRHYVLVCATGYEARAFSDCEAAQAFARTV